MKYRKPRARKKSYDNDIVSNINMDEQVVSRSSGMYGISRKINVLQRLFSCHTLRDFDLRLVDSESTIENDELPEHVCLK